jgi:hypothetical protein
MYTQEFVTPDQFTDFKEDLLIMTWHNPGNWIDVALSHVRTIMAYLFFLCNFWISKNVNECHKHYGILLKI